MSLTLLMLNSNVYTEEYFKQDDVCRLCWGKNADREISPEATETDRETKNQLADKIRYCLNIEITSEIYPKKACASCCSNLEKFYEFKSFCCETDRRLRDLFKNYDLKVPVLFEGPCEVKVEKNDYVNVEFSKTDSLDSFFESLHHSDVSTDLEDLEKKKSKIKNKYKPKRSPSYCNICCQDYKTVEKFAFHNSQCHGVENNGEYKCFGCEKKFKSRKTRLGHEKNFCKGLKDGYKCSHCHRYLPKRRMYEVHMRNHRDNVTVELPEDIFKCVKCCQLFKTRDDLKNHMAVHELEKKNFVCETCGRVFTRQDYLHKHKLTHSGLKQHICPHCGFRATQRSSLTVHIRKHTGERPYSCDLCPQRCISSSNLRAHRRRHLGLKKYECTICTKKFGYKISLEEHVASTHERSQSHPCPHCGALYTRVRGLRRHLLAKHGKEKDVKTVDTCAKVGKEPCELKESEEFVLKNQDQVYIV